MPALDSTAPGRGSPAAPLTSSLNVFSGLRCTPSRRSLKFTADTHARHFLAFDTSISREERLTLFMELFVFRQLLVDAATVPAFQAATYTPEELLEVRVVTDPRHPAYGQAGLYARSSIPHNTIVTPYSGFIEVFATSCNSRTYTMGFGSIGDDYALDAEFVGNFGRYANDPRGVGTLQANLSAENRFNGRGESFTALVARRQISAGEEILMSYGKAHGLSSTPWMTMQGEPITRPRMGGVVPFPVFRTPEAAPCLGECKGSVGGRGEDGVRAVSSGETKEMSSSAEETVKAGSGCSTSGPERPGTSCGASVGGTGTTASNAASSGDKAGAALPLPSVANDLLWECTQCGMWTLCEASVADAPLLCSACGLPKLSGARYVGLLSSPAITQDDLLAEAGLREARAPPHDSASSPLSSSQPQPTPSSSSVSTVGATSSFFSSEHADWPMNVPFLPWQVWDAAVPLSVLAKHSRFETQSHMFLYTVDTGLGEEEEEEEGSRRRGKRAAPAAVESKNAPEVARWTQRLEDDVRAQHRADSSASDDDDEERDEEASLTAATAPPRSSRTNSSGHNGSGATSASRGRWNGKRREEGNGGRVKRGVLWERQGDVDPDDLARLKRGLSPATPAVSTSSPVAPNTTGATGSLPSLPLLLRQVQHDGGGQHDAAVEGSEGPEGSLNQGEHGTDAPLTRSPLSLLLASTSEVDRLIVLRRRPARTVNAAGYSAQMAGVRRRLQCMTRRLFTGKTFQPGEVVSYVGGLVRQRGDSRCRVSDSCLEIPLPFFLPPTLRRLCRAPTVDAGTMQARLESARYRSEGTALHRFCRRLGGFSLVVTSEFMYCPCVVLDEEGEGEEVQNDNCAAKGSSAALRHTMDEVESALSACNVALVLTLDSLGCPYACAVATKPIGAFEPLLARAQ